MKRAIFAFLAVLLSPDVRAIPQNFTNGGLPGLGGGFFGPVVPARPKFNADLTRAVLDMANWDAGKFPGPWQSEPALPGQEVRQMAQVPVLFGAVPDSVFAYAENGKVREVAITYLDAGSFFGYQAGGEKTSEQKQAGRERREEFAKHWRALERALRAELADGCGRGRVTTVGRVPLLRTECTDFDCEGFMLRLVAREGHSVALHIARESSPVRGYLDESVTTLSAKERKARWAQNVTREGNGDVLVGGIPVFQQGTTPFCGIHSLASVAHYFGLRMGVDGLAAGARFRNTGSAKGSQIVDLYRAAAEEVGMRLSAVGKLDAERVRRSLDAGMPVIVWRRVTAERDAEHTAFARKFADDRSLQWPAVTPAEQARWPKGTDKKLPAHATIITGYNAERGEFIFMEPWGEHTRGRRMRQEEMAAASYAVFQFKLQ